MGRRRIVHNIGPIIVIVIVIAAAAAATNRSPSVAAERNIGWNGMGWIDYLIRR